MPSKTKHMLHNTADALCLPVCAAVPALWQQLWMHKVFAVAEPGLSSDCRCAGSALKQAVLLVLLQTPDSKQLCGTSPA